jgi:membrane protein YdbS with pleckstrin-like domain
VVSVGEGQRGGVGGAFLVSPRFESVLFICSGGRVSLGWMGFLVSGVRSKIRRALATSRVCLHGVNRWGFVAAQAAPRERGGRARYTYGMAYPERLLTDDETIVVQFRPHWRMLFIPILWIAAGIVAVWLVYRVPPDNGTIDLITSGVVFAALIPAAIIPLIAWWFTGYILTSERLITRNGILSRSGIEIPLENVNNVMFSQTLLERVLKSGDLLVESAGESGQSRFSDIPNPEEFQSLLYKTRELRTGGTSGKTPATPIGSHDIDSMDKLERLTQLHRDGVISDEEFADKRRQFLDEL